MRHPDSPSDPWPKDPDRSSLGEALAWLDRHINLEAIERGVAGRAAEPTLERIAALLRAMGNPEEGIPVIHVTGTNGKGSTTRIASTLLEARGLSVGTYTSPDLEALNERIARNGAPIPDRALLEGLIALQAVEDFLARQNPGGVAPTWFELITALAIGYFSDEAVDAAVIEVGLGGRYDATNVVDATVAVVTNVELDHVEILGHSREEIAREKAGIIKVNSIAVVGETDPAIADIFSEEARRVGANVVWRRDEDFACVGNLLAHGGRLLDLRTPGASYDGIYLPLYGAHQGDNAVVALAAAEAFFGAPFERDVVEEAFAAVSVPGRLEVVGRRPLLLLDGAHNVAGASALGAALAEDFAAPERIVLVMGCLRGRDPGELLAALGTERIVRVLGCSPPSPRALPAAAVVEAARAAGLPASEHDTVEEALAAALEVAEPGDLVLVTGSLYVVGAARREARRLVCSGL